MKPGYYLNLKTLGINCVNTNETLPEGRNIRLPFLVALIFAAMMGAAFLMFLPVIGVYLVIYAMVKRTMLDAETEATEVTSERPDVV